MQKVQNFLTPPQDGCNNSMNTEACQMPSNLGHCGNNWLKNTVFKYFPWTPKVPITWAENREKNLAFCRAQFSVYSKLDSEWCSSGLALSRNLTSTDCNEKLTTSGMERGVSNTYPVQSFHMTPLEHLLREYVNDKIYKRTYDKLA